MNKFDFVSIEAKCFEIYLVWCDHKYTYLVFDSTYVLLLCVMRLNRNGINILRIKNYQERQRATERLQSTKKKNIFRFSSYDTLNMDAHLPFTKSSVNALILSTFIMLMRPWKIHETKREQ